MTHEHTTLTKSYWTESGRAYELLRSFILLSQGSPFATPLDACSISISMLQYW